MEDLTKAMWLRSSYSAGSPNGGGNCVEVAGIGARRAVRDSKNPAGSAHLFPADAWSAFVAAVKDGEFDLS